MTAAQFRMATHCFPDLVEYARSMAEHIAEAQRSECLTYTNQLTDVHTGRVLWLMTEGVN